MALPNQSHSHAVVVQIVPASDSKRLISPGVCGPPRGAGGPALCQPAPPAPPRTRTRTRTPSLSMFEPPVSNRKSQIANLRSQISDLRSQI
eukprot:102296-Rhodomonas_salina.1